MSIKDNFPSVGPSLSLNFARSKTLDPRITFSRSSVGTYMDDNGLVATASTDSPRFDHKIENGVVKSLGLLVEESRINQIRNNTMTGASIGTPPTNWTLNNMSGLTWSITGTGIDAGVYYVDIRLSGTSDARPSSPTVAFESESQIPASNGQTWITSCFIKIVSGTTNNITQISLGQKEWSGTSYLSAGFSSDLSSSINSSTTNIFSSCRYSYTGMNGNSSTTFLQPYLLIVPTGSAVIDITLRIGMPQTELGAFITSVIPTSAGISTRGADNVTMTGTNFSDWYNQSEGTIYCSFRSVSQSLLTNYVMGISNNSVAELIYIRAKSTGSDSAMRDGSSQVAYKSIAYSRDIDTLSKHCVSYKQDDFIVSAQGQISTVDDGCTVPTPTNISIGSLYNTTQLGGTISQLTYYPKRLTNTQLQNLTK